MRKPGPGGRGGGGDQPPDQGDPPPPGWARTLLRTLLVEPYRGEVLADLEEGYRERAKGGSRLLATLWYLAQMASPDTVRLAWLLRRQAATRTDTTEWERRRGGTMGRDTGVGGWFVTFRDDLGYALRSLVRNPGYAIFACLTLALGIGATTAIFSGVESILLRPLPYDVADRMYTIMRPYGDGALIGPTQREVDVWKEQEDLFEALDRVGFTGKTLTGQGPAQPAHLGMIRPDIQKILSLQPLLGRPISEEDVRGDGAKVVLLSHHLWQDLFGGDAGVLGRSLTLNGEPWTIIGVMPPRTPFPNGFVRTVELWGPMAETNQRGTLLAIAREGVTSERIQNRLDRIQDEAVERGEAAIEWGGSALAVTSQVGGRIREPLRILMAAVALLLIIACVNVANLLLSRSTLRRHETAIRAAIGASRGRLARQLLLESLLIAGAGAAAGLLLAVGALELAGALRPGNLAILDEIRLNERVLLFTMGVGALAGILFGTMPAWKGSGGNASDALKSGARLNGRGVVGPRLRWLLVGGEVALSFALLVGSVMALRALAGLQARDTGFRTEGLVAVQVSLPAWKYPDPALRNDMVVGIKEGIARLGGVEEVAVGTGVPPEVGLWIGNGQAQGREPVPEANLFFGAAIDAEYLRVVGIPLVRGRSFTEEEIRNGDRVTIMGETAARTVFGEEDPLGRPMRVGDGDWYTVVGIAADIAMQGLSATNADIQHYRPRTLDERTVIYAVRLAPDVDAGGVIGAARSAVRESEPDAFLGVTDPVERLMGNSVAQERFTSVLLSAFAVLAVILAAVGLYGVVSQVVGQRIREIGIRVSLGAQASDVRRLVLGGGARATVLGILAGTALAVAGLRVLSSRIFGLEEGAGGATSYAAAAVLLALVTLAASWVPTRRAVRVDPMEALRVE